MNKGLFALREEVLETSACTACGSCVALCPTIYALHDRIGIIGQCTLDAGRCYSSCPRTTPDQEHEAVLCGDVAYGGAVGPYLQYCIASGMSSKERATVQYGGVVTTLLSHALDANLITSAIVTKAEGNLPIPLTACSREGIYSAACSKFSVALTNKEANKTLSAASESIGVVALPCQATGLRKRQLMSPHTDIHEGNIALIIGLFCTWALHQDGWRFLVDSLGAGTMVIRTDIPPPPASVMRITTHTGVHTIPLDRVREAVREGCTVCLDMTAENADISVGMVEGHDTYNTVIVRTEQGKKLLDSAVRSGILETALVDEVQWNHLRQASVNKKRRAADEAKLRGEDLPYYRRILAIQKQIFEEDV